MDNTFQNGQASKVLLLKGLPLSAKENVMLNICRQFGFIADFLFIWDQ